LISKENRGFAAAFRLALTSIDVNDINMMLMVLTQGNRSGVSIISIPDLNFWSARHEPRAAA
jgi:hypothetical protein